MQVRKFSSIKHQPLLTVVYFVLLLCDHANLISSKFLVAKTKMQGNQSSILYYIRSSNVNCCYESQLLLKYWEMDFSNSSYQRWSRGHKARGQRHKKIRGQGQGQPYRGQTFSKPRTGILEAKAKDQGHKRKYSPKEKKMSSEKNFRRSPKKKDLQKHCLGDLQKKPFSIKFPRRSTNF